MAQKKTGVKTEHPDYVAMLPIWKRARDVYAGTLKLREYTTEYLPKLTDEENDAYLARLNRTVLYNSFYRTISGFLGMLFRVPAVVDAPPNTLAMFDDITLTGIPLSIWVQNEVALECMIVNRVGLLVNYPVTDEAMTIADAGMLNIRPSMAAIKAEQIINWKERRVNNKYSLSMAVIKEDHAVPIDEFEDKIVTRYRVLDLDENDVYRVRIIEPQESKGKVVDVEIERYYPIMNSKTMNYIPFYITGTANIKPDVDMPIMSDLADLCIAHFMAYADLANACHWQGAPTLNITGHEIPDGTTLRVGAGKALILPNPAARVGIVEVGTAGFSALENQLNRLESQMITVGSKLLEQHRVQAESSTTAIIYRAGENSILSALSISVSTAITIALKTFTEWARDNPESVRFTLNKEFFREPVTPEMITALVGAMQGGAGQVAMISKEAIFDYLQKSEFFPSHATFEEEQAKIEAGMPKPVAPPAIVTKIQKMPDGSMQATRSA